MSLCARIDCNRQPLRGYVLVGLILPLGKGIKDQEFAVPMGRDRPELSFDAARFRIDEGRPNREQLAVRVSPTVAGHGLSGFVGDADYFSDGCHGSVLLPFGG